jgi:parvulin-like peptidyl-prolyl isomerase
MKLLRAVIALLVLSLATAVLAACGGADESVPANAIAIVGEQEIPKSDFEALLAQARASYEAQKSEENPEGRPFPKAGTPEYNTLKTQAVAFLVQRAQFEQKAKEFDIQVTDKQVTDRLADIKKQYFGGDEKKYTEQLKQQNLSDAQVRRDIRAQLIQEELYKKVTADVKVSEADVRKHYDENQEQYGTPESRDVRHILVPGKKLADQLYAQLQDGANFAALAKKHSKDPGSAAQGGKLTVAKGATVPEFDKLAFELDENELATPVKTQYGWHIIQAVSETKPAKVTPFAEVKESIEQQLLQTRKNERMTKWVEDVKKEYAEETVYQIGFAPPQTATQPAETQ